MLTHFEKLLKWKTTVNSPHQSGIASEWSKLDIFKRRLETKYIQGFFLRNRWETEQINPKGYSLQFLPDQIRSVKTDQMNVLFLLLKIHMVYFWTVCVKSHALNQQRPIQKSHNLQSEISHQMQKVLVSFSKEHTCLLLEYCRESSNKRQVKRFHMMFYTGVGWCSTLNIRVDSC